MKQNRAILGIVFYERTIAVCEVENSGGSVRVRKNAEFNMPENVTVENVTSINTPFGAFLKEQGFRAKKAVIGISAHHLLSTLLKVPPIQDVQTRYETVQIHLERKLEVELSDIVFDYWNGTDPDSHTTLALMTFRKTIDQIKLFLGYLKIVPLRVTAASLGIDFVSSQGIDCNMVEYPHSVEVFLFEKGDLKAVLNIAKKSKGGLNGELTEDIIRQVNRTLWSLSATDQTPNYFWWTNHRESLKGADNFAALFGNLKRMEIKGDGFSASSGTLCDFAGQLAVRTLAAEPLEMNFLNGHHQKKKTTIPRQWWSRIAVLATVLIVLLGLYFFSWYSDRSAIIQYQRQLDSMKEDVQAARQMIDQVGFARRWFQRQPVHLEMLRELTQAFPQNSDIWLTSLAVDESLNQVIAGRATSENAILDVVDTLKSSLFFEDIKLLYIRKTGKNSEIMTFAINFHSRGEQ